MLTLIAIVALAQGPVVVTINGQPSPAAPDAPLKQGSHACGTAEQDLDAQGCHALLQAGTAAPYSGVLLDEQEDVHRTRRETRVTVQLQDLKTGNFIMPIAAYLGITGGAVAVALAILSAVLAATGHLK